MICTTTALVTNGVMTGTSEIDSLPLWIGTASGFCIQAIWTGTATGTIKLQASNAVTRPDPLAATTAAAVPSNSWSDIASSSYSVTAAGSYTWNFTGAYYPWVRAVYANATNTGVLQVTGTFKSEEIVD
jgi:hypothetical protein